MPNQTVWCQAATVILAALNAAGAPAVFYRTRFEAVSQTETAGNLFTPLVDCKYECAQDSVKIDASMVVRVDIAAVPGSGIPVDLVADPIIVWAWQRIRTDPTLGQLVEDVYIDKIETGFVDKAASDQISVDITVRVEVEVGRNDPSLNMTYQGM